MAKTFNNKNASGQLGQRKRTIYQAAARSRTLGTRDPRERRNAAAFTSPKFVGEGLKLNNKGEIETLPLNEQVDQALALQNDGGFAPGTLARLFKAMIPEGTEPGSMLYVGADKNINILPPGSTGADLSMATGKTPEWNTPEVYPAPGVAQYLLLQPEPDLPFHRVFTPGFGLEATDGGASDDYTLAVKDVYKKYNGFPYDPDTGYQVTLSYSDANRQVTITPTGADFDVYLQGVKYTFTGAQVSDAHADVSDEYFIYYDETGTLTTDTSPWDLLKHAPVCSVVYNATDGEGVFVLMELHTATRDPQLHYRLHFGDGTQVSSNPGLPTIGGYTLATSTPAAICWSATAVTVLDEDIEITSNTILDDAGPYRIAYRNGATGEWTIQAPTLLPTGEPVPFLTNGTICYNEWTGATWQKTALNTAALGEWVNMYLCATTDITEANRYFIVPGQAVFSSLVDAQNEDSTLAISWGDSPPEEFALIARFTYHGRSTFGAGTHYTQLDGVELLSGRKPGSSAGPGVTDHGSLSGLADDDHTQYLNETRHDALAADNPHSVTFTQAVTADGGTDISAAEAETLTDGSDADALHSHDHGNLAGLADDDHSQYHNDTRGDARYFTKTSFVDASTGTGSAGAPVKLNSSGMIDPTMYTGGTGVTDHGALTGLADDDHSQYHNDTRGDARYYQQSEFITTSTGVGSAGKPVKLSGTGKFDSSVIPASAVPDHGTLSGLADDDHTQYHNDTRGDARYFTQGSFLSASTGTGSSGSPIVLDSNGLIDPSMLPDPAVFQRKSTGTPSLSTTPSTVTWAGAEILDTGYSYSTSGVVTIGSELAGKRVVVDVQVTCTNGANRTELAVYLYKGASPVRLSYNYATRDANQNQGSVHINGYVTDVTTGTTFTVKAAAVVDSGTATLASQLSYFTIRTIN